MKNSSASPTAETLLSVRDGLSLGRARVAAVTVCALDLTIHSVDHELSPPVLADLAASVNRLLRQRIANLQPTCNNEANWLQASFKLFGKANPPLSVRDRETSVRRLFFRRSKHGFPCGVHVAKLVSGFDYAPVKLAAIRGTEFLLFHSQRYVCISIPCLFRGPAQQFSYEFPAFPLRCTNCEPEHIYYARHAQRFPFLSSVSAATAKMNS